MKFSKKTKYYTGTVYEFNLPTGWSCPFAKDCLVKVDRNSGKFDNASTSYKCYAASAERFPAVRKSRWENYEAVKSGGIPKIPAKATAIRIHSAGDFFNQKYFDMWLKICRENPAVEFWAYTKSLQYWVNRLDEIPPNLTLTASYGGKQDHLILEHHLKSAMVVNSVAEAMGGLIDTNDDIARIKGVSFYLVDNFAKQ